MMPRLSGTELLASLRATPAWAGLPELMLTARADQAHRAAAHTLGVDDYLTKPFTPAELLTHVRTLLQRQQVRRHFATLAAEEAAPPPASPPKTSPGRRPGRSWRTGRPRPARTWPTSTLARSNWLACCA